MATLESFQSKPVATVEVEIETNFSDDKGERIVLLGPPKAGKTQCAGTLSAQWPKKLPTSKRVRLADTLWLSADARACDTFKGLNIEVDQVALWKMFSPTTKPEAILLPVLEMVRDLVCDGKKSLVVLDSVSQLDKLIMYYYARVNRPQTTGGKRDSFAIWREAKADHLWVHGALNRLPCNVIFIMHSKVAGETAQRKAQADALPGGFTNVVMDTDYQDAANIYRRQNSLVCSVQVEKDGTRRLYTQPKNGIEAGTRYEMLLDLCEEPHLGKLFAKIQKGLGGGK